MVLKAWVNVGEKMALIRLKAAIFIVFSVSMFILAMYLTPLIASPRYTSSTALYNYAKEQCKHVKELDMKRSMCIAGTMTIMCRNANLDLKVCGELLGVK